MVRSLNKIIVFLLVPFFALAQQTGSQGDNYQDYKDPAQHEKFLKRRKLVSAWQINQLKTGALVVRLKTNRLAIEGLRQQGNEEAAKKLEAESFAINKNTMFAYMENLTFCKVYFINSTMSDSLLNGARKGIFLDTNLRVDPSIEMKENFYLIAERDYGYNSSIGFVPEPEAKRVIEKGNPSKQMAIVLKNKYGHQLKNPMPHEVQEKVVNTGYDFPVSFIPQPGGYMVVYYINRKPVKDIQQESVNKKKNPSGYVSLPKHFTYFKLAGYVSELNEELKRYYQKTPPPDPNKIPEDAKPFLY